MKNGKRADHAAFADVLIEMGAITSDQVGKAVIRQQAGDARPLDALLVELGFATSDQVDLALLRLRARQGDLGATDGLRLLEEATERTRRASSRIKDLGVAATELSNGATKR